MINTNTRKTITAKHMQYLLMMGILYYMFIFQHSLFNIPFLQEKSIPVEKQVIQLEKPVPAPVEEKKIDLFEHQIKKAEKLYNPIILKAANLHDVDLTMVRAIIMAESGYKRKSRSRYGAGGLMQLMPRTAKSLGVKDVYNPEENIHAGVRYYKSLLDRFDGDAKLALAAYNAGATNVRRYKGVPPFGETRRYIKRVLAYQQFYKYGPDSEKSKTI